MGGENIIKIVSTPDTQVYVEVKPLSVHGAKVWLENEEVKRP